VAVPPITRTVAYGVSPEQVADLRVPPGVAPAAGWPTVVLVHGGFWRDRYRRDLMVPLAEDLADRGFASWNVEYRRVGPTGGGVPATLEDLAAVTDGLVDLTRTEPIDLARVSVVGHSAGGHLALWVAGRHRLPAGATGAGPRLVPCAVVGQAPVASLRDGPALGDGAIADFVGGTPEQHPDRYALADPIGLVGHGVPTLLVHGEADDVVPVEQSERYEAAASAAGDPVRLVRLPGDHDAVIDPSDELWTLATRFLGDHV
jgi:acetyl esterase/lipase